MSHMTRPTPVADGERTPPQSWDETHTAPKVLTVVVATEVLTEVATAEAATTPAALLAVGCMALGNVAQPARHLLASLCQHLLQSPVARIT